ncbi:MAG: BolA/IbaG family iron-sulfur metabolism protein [Gammaproteobacteria bacterium]|nr:BolA/IbaG family iron-sulfur metabolism protein [Gammaproteobacteria bacterium]
MMTPEKIKQLIEDGLTGSEARVYGEDGTHFEAVIISDDFGDKTTLQRHQLVYAALGGLMGTDIHALSMRTYTPGEWQEVQGKAAGEG